MAPIIHLIRHGQGLHNVGAGFYNLPDPRLTPEGEAQCIALREKHFGNASTTNNKISLIATSPMTRAIQSAYLIFQPLLLQQKPDRRRQPQTLLAIPDAQETSDDPCDIGSDPDLLRKVCDENHWPVDLSLVTPGWNDKRHRGRYSPSSKAIFRRARDVRLFLRQRARELIAAGDDDENVEIVLLAHGGFMHYFTNDWEGADARPGTGWVNCEMRSYVFEVGVDDDESDGEARLVELMESRKERGLEHPMLGLEEQAELYEKTMKAWESQGLQNHAKVGDGEEDGVNGDEDEDGGELSRQHTCRQ